MTVSAISWAFRQKITSPGAKFVLVALADHANERDEAYPSQARLAAFTGHTDRTVRTHLRWLEDRGFITHVRDIPSQKGHFPVAVYRLNMPAEKSSAGRASQRKISTPPAEDFARQPAEKSSAEPSYQEPSGEPKDSPSGSQAGGGTPSVVKGSGQQAIALRMIALYHEHCPSLPPIAKVTHGRAAILTRMLREDFHHDLGAWAGFLRMVEANDFLTGRKRGKGRDWKADLGWIIQPDNFVKIIEGRYAQNQGSTANDQVRTDHDEDAAFDQFRTKPKAPVPEDTGEV